MGREARVRRVRETSYQKGTTESAHYQSYADAKEFAASVELHKRAEAIGLILAPTIVRPDYQLVKLPHGREDDS